MIEPEEGKYDFEWLDRAVSLAEKYGLKVIMCTPTPVSYTHLDVYKRQTIFLTYCPVPTMKM